MAHSTKKRFCTYGVVRTVIILLILSSYAYLMVKHSGLKHPNRRNPSFHRPATVMKATFNWPPAVVKTTIVTPSCPKCSCDCLPDMDSIALPLDKFNTSLSVYTDCAKNDPEMNEEMKKDRITLLSEEIELHKSVTRTFLDGIQQSITDVKQTSSKFQKEAQKCNTGVQVCEDAREKAEADLAKEIKLSALWEQRAREFGWED